MRKSPVLAEGLPRVKIQPWLPPSKSSEKRTEYLGLGPSSPAVMRNPARSRAATALGLKAVASVPPEKVRVVQATIGGGFGSKLDLYPYEPIAVHLARRTRRPVKIVFNRREEFVASPTRQPVRTTLSPGLYRGSSEASTVPAKSMPGTCG